MSLELEEILDFVKSMGGGLKHPHDEFYEEGNKDSQLFKSLGMCDFDEENFYHKPYPEFSCHIPGCERIFETVIEYESHYNSCHSYTCKECNKNLPNYHLLDLHIAETHDSFFMAQAKKKPMYKCFLEECNDCFNNPIERRNHCIETHKFPSDFRFDSARKITGFKKNLKKKSAVHGKNLGSLQQMDIVQSSEDECMMTISKNETKKTGKKPPEFKGFSFGRSQSKRKPVFYNFSKDLMDSLPKP